MQRTEAYDRFKDQLFRRDFVPGQFLSQRELTLALHMPMASVREAVRMLEQEKLIKVIPQRGIQVADVDVDLIRNAFGLRVIIEGAAALHFIKHGSPRVLELIERETLRMLDASAGDVTDAVLDEAFRVDEMLHFSLVESLGNPLVAGVHRLNQDKIRLIRLKGRYTPERLGPAMEEHLAIIRELRSGNPVETLAQLERHLATARARALGMGD